MLIFDVSNLNVLRRYLALVTLSRNSIIYYINVVIMSIFFRFYANFLYYPLGGDIFCAGDRNYSLQL